MNAGRIGTELDADSAYKSLQMLCELSLTQVSEKTHFEIDLSAGRSVPAQVNYLDVPLLPVFVLVET